MDLVYFGDGLWATKCLPAERILHTLKQVSLNDCLLTKHFVDYPVASEADYSLSKQEE